MDTTVLLTELQSKATFPDADFPSFLNLFEPLCVKKKEYIYRAGDVVKYAVFVVKGCLRHYYCNEEGIERIIYFAQENWWVGDLVSLHSGNPTNLNLQALEDCDLLIINKNNFDVALRDFSGFTEYYNKGVQKVYTKLQEQVGQSTADSAETKYQRLLRDNPRLVARVPQHYIATFLGITPESLSRVIKKVSAK